MIEKLLLDNKGKWVLLSDIMGAVHTLGTATVTARIRDLRKARYGGYTVECDVDRYGVSSYRLS